MRREARRSGGGKVWAAEQRASAAAGPTGKPGDAGGRVGVAFVGVCLAVVPVRLCALRGVAPTGGTAVGWGADYKRFVMLQSPTPALTPPRIYTRATLARAAAAPWGRGLRSRVGRHRVSY